MAYISVIQEDAADADLAALYKRVGNPDGSVDNVMKIHGLSPSTLRTHFEMYVEAMHRPSPLSRAEREMVAVAVSRLNGCVYCQTHHHAGLVRRLPAERKSVAYAVRDGARDGTTDRERAMLDWSEKLTHDPAAMRERDIAPLRDAGLDDRAILDLAQCVGYFNYVNRIVNGLGVKLGDGEGDAGQWPDE